MKFIDVDPTLSVDDQFAARGPHLVILEEDDQPANLRAARPELGWSAVGLTPVTLPYADCASLVIPTMRIDGEGFTDQWIGCCAEPSTAFTRAWQELLKGIPVASWTPHSRGGFDGVLREASHSPFVDRSKLVLQRSDLYPVLALGQQGALTIASLSWASSLTFSRGSLADSETGSLAKVADLEYYTEQRFTVPGCASDSALAAHLGLVYDAAAQAMEAAGTGANFIHSLRPAAKASMVNEYLKVQAWPPQLSRHCPTGPRREVDALTRVGYAHSGGVGAAAERVVVGMLSTVLAWPPWAILSVVLDGAEAGHAQVAILRRWQAVYSLDLPDIITLGSLGRMVFLLGEHAAILRSPEFASLPAAQRPERMADSRLPTRPGAPAAGAESAAPAMAKGPSRFDARSLAALMAFQPYLDQKRAVLAYLQAGEPLAAIRVALTGVLPVATAASAPAAGVPGAPAAAPTAAAPATSPPLQPLTVFHICLFTTADCWQIDRDLAPLTQLREHLPRYAGQRALRAMGAPHDVVLDLPLFVAAWLKTENWKSSPLDIVNHAWLPALAAINGEDAGASWATVPPTRLYTPITTSWCASIASSRVSCATSGSPLWSPGTTPPRPRPSSPSPPPATPRTAACPTWRRA